VRWRRMRGDNALWLPGTDHAGIATQLMVERDLAKEGLHRTELGRERFLERMWAWKSAYHDNIRRQLERMGSSCDFSRERFTLDEGLSRAVREAFVRLHEEGKIYRGEYIVNWSPGLDTAISDLEVEMRTVEGTIWRIAYPVEGSDERIVVATTRPETMLGDTAVAFHPEDERYAHLGGKRAIVPVAGRAVPFVADEAVEREFGTGLVKVTPFHDPADFEMGRRHDLRGIQVIDRRGRMTAEAGAEFEGLTVEEAREKLLARLKADGFLVGEQKHVHNVGFCQRSGTRVEPQVSTQWFCDVSEMASGALDAWRHREDETVEDSLKVNFVPASWGKTWEHWLTNIRPWCISRQLWWGHQIPAWYDDAGDCFVARSLEEAIEAAGTDRLTQDPDVLDTWFSSALWPFSTLGWPEQTPDLARWYPTNVLITGHDILFFWVARMVMFGLHFTDKSPFERVHLTGLVRDAEGQKMSKTKGNVLDPEELIEEYGADAMRFTLAQLDAPGRDIPLDASRMAGYRAFGNKIWNATRFVLSKAEGGTIRTDFSEGDLHVVERWILHRLDATAGSDDVLPSEARETGESSEDGVEGEFGKAVELRGVNGDLQRFRFDLACHQLYQFFWSEYCDWYIEMAKPALSGGDGRDGTADVLVTVLDRALRLLHPVMPHLTEELWQRLPGRAEVFPETETICLAPYPVDSKKAWLTPEEEVLVGLFQQLIQRKRNRSTESGGSHHARVKEVLVRPAEAGDDSATRLARRLADEGEWGELFRSLGQIGKVTYSVQFPEGGDPRDQGTIDGLLTYRIDWESTQKGSVDLGALEVELDETRGHLKGVRARLANRGFLDKAPEQVVEGARRQEATLEAKVKALEEAIAAAGGAESAG